MANIINILYHDYVKPYKKYMLILALIIIFGVAGMYAFKWFAEPMMDNQGADNVANANFRSGEVQVYIFMADWCPHCKKAKPEFSKFQAAYEGKNVNGYTVKCMPIDCSDGTAPQIQQFNIKGYPTAFIMKDNKRIDFDSKITQSNLEQFLNTILS